MRKGIILLALVAAFFGVKAVLNSLMQPAEGMVVIEMPTDPMINDMGGVDETTVMTEEEMMETEMEDTAMEPVETKPVFTPLNFTGKKVKKFAKANGGKVMAINNTYARALINFGLDKADLPNQVIKVNGDLYFKSKSGVLYVAHMGELIKL